MVSTRRLEMSVGEWTREWSGKMKETHYPKGDLVKWAGVYLKHFIGKRILEVGSGSGVYSAKIAKKGAEVWAVDFSEGATQLSQLTADRNRVNVQVCRADGLCLPFSDSFFDLVFSEGLLEHISPDAQEQILREQIRVVKPRGFIIVDIPFQYETRKVCEEALDAVVATRKIRLRRTYTWRGNLDIEFPDGADLQRIIQISMRANVLAEQGIGFIYQDTRPRIPWFSQD